MTRIEAYLQLKTAGYSFTEAWQLIRYLEEEKRLPTSRTKANKLRRVETAFREAGIDPDKIEFFESHPA